MTFYLLETIELSSSTNTIEFSNIPQDYLDLYVIGSFKISTGFFLQRNGSDMLSQFGFTFGNNSGTNQRTGFMAVRPPSSESDNFYTCEIHLPNYAGSLDKTAAITFGRVDSVTSEQNNAFGVGTARAGSAAITSLGFRGNNNNFLAGTIFSLYTTGA